MEDPAQGATAAPGSARLGHATACKEKGMENHIDLDHNSQTGIPTFLH